MPKLTNLLWIAINVTRSKKQRDEEACSTVPERSKKQACADCQLKSNADKDCYNILRLTEIYHLQSQLLR